MMSQKTDTLALAADKFYKWLDNLCVPKNPEKNFDAWLVEFLIAGQGFALIKTYEDFCSLAVFMSLKGDYSFSSPPCRPIDYAMQVDESKYRAHYVDLKIPASITNLDLAAESFARWMKMKNKPWILDQIRQPLNHNKELVEYLEKNSYLGHIKNFDEFCKLAELLKTKGYTTTNPPCDEDVFKRANNQPFYSTALVVSDNNRTNQIA